MFRQLVGLVLLSLAAFGLSPAQAETLYHYSGPPKLEVYGVVDDNDAPVTNLQPLVSSSTDRTYYTVRVDVLTNGSIDEIDVVAMCFYSAGNVSGNLYDDDACGYNTNATDRAGKIAPPTSYDPAHFISLAWTTANAFRLDRGADVQHKEDGSTAEATTTATRSVAGQTVTYTSKRLNFRFTLSHAAVNTDDWQIRAVAVSTPTPYDSEEVSSRAARHIYCGALSNKYQDGSQLASAPGADGSVNTNCDGDDHEQFGVNFFGGFVSSTVRDSVDYGAISEFGSAESGLIDTADYFSNDLASISISASAFAYSDDSIPLTEAGNVGSSVTGREIALDCIGQGDSGQTVRVGTSPKALFTGLESSSSNSSSETERSAPQHECDVFYGFGARYANSTYANTVTLGIFDGDPGTGPNSVGVFESVETFDVSTDGNNTANSDVTTRSTTDSAIRPSGS